MCAQLIIVINVTVHVYICREVELRWPDNGTMNGGLSHQDRLLAMYHTAASTPITRAPTAIAVPSPTAPSGVRPP